MKNLKQYLFLALMFLLGISATPQTGFAQDVIEIPLTNPGEPGKLKVHVLNGSIIVKGYDKKFVTVVSGQDSKEQSKSYKNGMRKVAVGGNGLNAEEYNNVVRISKSNVNSKSSIEVMVPRSFSLNLKAVNQGSIYIENVKGEFEVSNLNGRITMKEIEGPVFADALNQDITVTFAGNRISSPMAFSSLNGDLDITFPPGIKADVKAKTNNGNFYTDFEVKRSNSSVSKSYRDDKGVYKVKAENTVSGTVNGGGPEISFSTLNGDILFRKR